MTLSRERIRRAHYLPQDQAISHLMAEQPISPAVRRNIGHRATLLVESVRTKKVPSTMEVFLGEYGLSSEEGIALMCLAEALLRVPDDHTMDALIEDKIAPSRWNDHLGQSHSSLVNASTWALFLTGKVLRDVPGNNIASTLRSLVKRLGEPVIRTAVSRVMRELGRQFVLGENISAAHKRAQTLERQGYGYSYDMLGEAALTEADADAYFESYLDAIERTGSICENGDAFKSPGISVKLSALHPRYETLQRGRVLTELIPRILKLATAAQSAGIGLTIDAEESGRLDLSLDIIEVLFFAPELVGWDGLGIVVQAYHQRAPYVLDWLYEHAVSGKRRIAVRLVKGAYWDTEIKHAQVNGLENFPVFTDKAATDVSYILCAQKLLTMCEWIYPQFATHNAHTVSAILELADGKDHFEFQRLHGMGEALHDIVHSEEGTRCRIYAPVGAHKDLLAYLVRRLLENGANSSFVNQIADPDIPAELVSKDPFSEYEELLRSSQTRPFANPDNIYGKDRRNSKGWDLENPVVLEEISHGLAEFSDPDWTTVDEFGESVSVVNPATLEKIGTASFCSKQEAEATCNAARPWSDISASARADILRKAADLYEDHAPELFAMMQQEAGKVIADCIGELREAVDFLRYYASQAEDMDGQAAGIFTCISPWNFPLAIFTGQIAAALATGNGVLAKPAEATTLIADYAVRLLKQAGVPRQSLILVPGYGSEVGPVLTSDPNVNGVCFTGSTATAQTINRTMAKNLEPHAPLIAETGGLNAMIVDSTALPEQAVADIISSAFQSAGQRCSALRILYLQDDIAEGFLTLLKGAMDELKLGDPRQFDTDIGPIIDQNAQQKIQTYVSAANKDGWLIKQLDAPETGWFAGPALISVSGIEALQEEIFGPVLHVATYKAEDIDHVLDAINAKGYGLTFGLHSRIDDRVQHVIDRLNVGNIYVNRNQIGAVVESQPFGGEGLSGTGSKAGGPRYVRRFVKSKPMDFAACEGDTISAHVIEQAFTALGSDKRPEALNTQIMPGPTGELNQLSLYPRGRVLCLGPTKEATERQVEAARALGCIGLAIAPGIDDGLDGVVLPEILTEITDLDAVLHWTQDNRGYRMALAAREGPIVPLLSIEADLQWLSIERHVCIDTTAAGGNAALLG